MRTISLAIAAYNSSAYLYDNLRDISDDPRIGEVIVRDDASADACELEKSLVPIKKARIIFNKENYGSAGNKALAIKECANKWAILLDCDNKIDKRYVDILYELTWEEDVIYCPVFAKPAFDYGFLSGRDLRKRDLTESFLANRMATAMLNTGNYLVPVGPYVECASSIPNRLVPDTLHFAFYWLRAGRRLLVVPGLEYEHRLRGDSLWMKNCIQGVKDTETIKNAILNGWSF